jgi:hypothetical protein
LCLLGTGRKQLQRPVSLVIINARRLCARDKIQINHFHSAPIAHVRSLAAPAGCSETPSPPLAPPCTRSSAATPQRRLCVWRRGPTPRWRGRRPSWLRPRARWWWWGAPCVLAVCGFVRERMFERRRLAMAKKRSRVFSCRCFFCLGCCCCCWFFVLCAAATSPRPRSPARA